MLAEASWAAWAAKQKIRVVLLKLKHLPGVGKKEHLHKRVSGALWRRDLFDGGRTGCK